MKIAITGASGYVGGCLAGRLRHLGHDVLSWSRRPCAAPWTSFTLDGDPVQLPWEGVQILVHAAHDFSAGTWQEMQAKNIKPGIALFEAARAAGVPHRIFISSLSAFEGCLSLYGKAKLAIEEEAIRLGALVLRPGLIWGNHSGGIMGGFETMVARSAIVPYPVSSSHLSQYLTHEEDLCAAILAFANRHAVPSGGLHTVAHPEPVPLPMILQAIAARTGVTRFYLPVPWQVVMAGLGFLKALGIRPPFRTDSLISLVQGYPKPVNSAPPEGVCYRSFH